MAKIYEWNTEENPLLSKDDIPVLHTLLQSEFLTQKDATTLYGGDSATVKGIKDSISAIEKNVEGLQSSVGTNTSDITSLTARVAANEKALAGLETSLNSINTKLGGIA